MADANFTPATNGNSYVDATKQNAAAAINTLASGPVATNVKDQTLKTADEFNNLANARKTPAAPAATGQSLTNYHSFFFELLSWNNPRASGIAYATIVSLIFAARYFDIIRYAFKLTWMVLGVTVASELAGKLILDNGFATQLRPRKYYTIPRETLDAAIGDVHELINFFVIETQRILFAENVSASAAAFFAAFISYYLVRIVPYWGLAVIGTTAAFFVPLIYTSNQELIDEQLKQATDIVNAQTSQLRNVASKHTAQAADITKHYVGDYTAKAQQLIRGRSASPEVAPKHAKPVQAFDFPAAPSHDIKTTEAHKESEPKSEPLVAL